MLAGFVTYSNDAKVRDLGVPADLIAQYGAVSAEVAAAMAEGARARSGATMGLAVTGIAGPTGATPIKPIGLVFVSLAKSGGTRTEELRFGEEPGRGGIRHLAAQTALNLTRLTLLRQ